jgi:hypothetical protein
MVPISIGWNCTPAIYRKSVFNCSKINGYRTCPFDLCVTPFIGLCECLLDGFDKNKFFNLRVEYDPINKQECILNEYNMWFNNESEENVGDKVVAWHPGKYADNNYKLFKTRYEARIQNFLQYVQSDSTILFILEQSHTESESLIKIIRQKYPKLKFKILLLNGNKELLYNQYLHSPDFPTSDADPIYHNNFTQKINKLLEDYSKPKVNQECGFINMNMKIYKKHYRAVILVLASNNTQIYRNGRKVWKAYMKVDPTIKVFFTYGKISSHEFLEDYDIGSDLIFDDIIESNDISIKKTVDAMKVINQLCSYDFFIRTNISTIIKIFNIIFI